MWYPLFTFVAVLYLTVYTSAGDAEERKLDFVKNDTLVIARIGESNQFAAYSKLAGGWTVHEFPTGIKAIPVVGDNLVVFALEGDRISELVAVDSNGKWQRLKLAESTKKCVPVVTSSIGVITIGKNSYGFSGTLGTWAVVYATAMPTVSNDTAMIVSDDRITMFSAQSGCWSASPNLSDSK